MVDEIRNKWCEDLEDLVQCPVCMERPYNAIYQCIQGHHVCQVCKPLLPQCPTCAQPWSTSRNRFAEHLCTKLDEIKISLIDPENEINKLLIPDKVSVASQTNEIETTSKKKQWGEAHHGKIYPCQIGTCSVQKAYDPMLKHLIIDHPEKYSELTSDGAVFQHSWTFHCVQDMIFDRAFLIADMGTFFLKLSTDIFGNFTGFILMIHNGFIAKHFTYQLEISCCAEHLCSIYTGEVCSCRTPSGVLLEKSLRINRQEIQKMLGHKDELTCTLLLGKKPVTEGQAEQAKPKNYQKNKQPKIAPKTRNPLQNNENHESSNDGSQDCAPNFNRLGQRAFSMASNNSVYNGVASNGRSQNYRPVFNRK